MGRPTYNRVGAIRSALDGFVRSITPLDQARDMLDAAPGEPWFEAAYLPDTEAILASVRSRAGVGVA